jgi:hypothetical protein
VPYKIIRKLAEYRKGWSDEAILAELSKLPVLLYEDQKP